MAKIIDEKPENSDLYCELLYFDENTGNSGYVDLRNPPRVLLCILDLCVYNEEGIAKISTDDVCSDSINPGWQFRFDKLKKQFNSIVDEYKKYKDEGYKEDFLKKYLLPKSSPHGNILFKPKIDLSIKGKESIIYDCRRIKRLCKPQAEAILLKYSHHISRSAFDHDFGKR
jgi:hypothetical protein